MKIHDISVRISPELVVYPGDPPVEIVPLTQVGPAGDPNTSRLCLSTHAGTHIDPPYHLLPDGTKANEIPLDTLIGECEVVDIGIEDEITLPVLQRHKITAERVIFKTKNSFLWERKEFSRNYTYLSTAAAEYLATRKLKLVGIDYLSIEKFDAKSLQAHLALLKAGTVILEGVNLSYVKPGKYELFCLPLKIKDGDGAPARAVLIER
jgi:arylformamidase